MDSKQIPRFTAKCRIIQGEGGFYLTFFCEICSKGYTTPLIQSASRKDALTLGEQEARLYFNRCISCFRWVCDENYNENLMLCTECQIQI